jgi:hypothetical protein
MFVCPLDMHWCDLTACRADGCQLAGERAGEPPFLLCHECGTFVVGATVLGLCVECVAIDIEPQKERL